MECKFQLKTNARCVNRNRKKKIMVKKKLSETEYQFMEYIWKNPDGVISQEIYKHFPQAEGTKGVILHNIKKKGYVKVERIGKQRLYTALINKANYDKMVMEEKIQDTIGVASLGALVAALCGKEKLTESQTEELYNFVEKIRNEDNE